MAIFKCKMCGGDLEVLDGATVCECEYCGTKQTLPKLDDEKRIKLYERANHFRRNNEFDKAEAIFETLLEDNDKDAESYWSLVLCRYGIQYVDDPLTLTKIPTVNRAQYISIFADEDFKKAIEYSDSIQREIYEKEAKQIDVIQKNILDISSKEEPFDIFICYRETDISGLRTEDSIYAQDIYNELTKQGYKVFFSRITLEDKLGIAYEPYIFAALNSAKVMLVVGTSKENMEAVWVKNEWSRYLALIKNGDEKTLIPCYKDMNPADMPSEFSYLQSQDISKIGFIQDLIHGVDKLLKKQINQNVTIPKVEKNNPVSKSSNNLKIILVILIIVAVFSVAMAGMAVVKHNKNEEVSKLVSQNITQSNDNNSTTTTEKQDFGYALGDLTSNYWRSEYLGLQYNVPKGWSIREERFDYEDGSQEEFFAAVDDANGPEDYYNISLDVYPKTENYANKDIYDLAEMYMREVETPIADAGYDIPLDYERPMKYYHEGKDEYLMYKSTDETTYFLFKDFGEQWYVIRVCVDSNEMFYEVMDYLTKY